MTEGRATQALKIYNEMKKRGQKPDAYTYMIVLRGLGNHAHHSSSVGNALAVYHSMSAPNSPVPPSVMHSNAVLRVCSRANDMDALWGVAAKLPEKGPGAADAFTYTTILQAIRNHALITPDGMSEDDVAHKREEAIVDGRRMWVDIVAKWRSGDIIIDEPLVCAMGQLLLIGKRPRDWDDVLSLFAQTMDIPRLLRHLGDDRKAKMPLPTTPQDMKTEDSTQIDPTDNMRRGGEFDPVELGKTVGRGRRSMAFAKPGNSSLSVILHSCWKMVAKKAAEDYFHLLTDSDSWGIAPDEANLHMYLRILRQARASAAAVEFLKDEFDGGRFRIGMKPQAKTFRIAMSTCVRDKNNPNVLDHANSILDMMATFLADLDMRTLAMYTRLLMSVSQTDQLLKSLERLGPHFVNVKRMLRNDERKPLAQEDWDAALEFLYGMISCYDRLKNKRDLPQEHYAVLMERKAKIHAFYGREILKREKRQGKDVRNPELNPGRRVELKAKRRREEESMGQANEED
ncbi:Pentatricopeptide repeat protein [Lasiodiplodia theobromae]|uniref:Pentatricopeptide repeat protein n=1 Tax=Lasiodiplodia theobromae TaxID=45133 RepID=UPI0015C2EAA0|nr:Pentatricopeptide repeat protein [Lasiodiplodia theobromae]KAF4544987.1 Pentatricopeptide repeat protein [Lasiodiplodia theobromae]